MWGVVEMILNLDLSKGRLLVNVWPKDDWKTRLTVLGGFGLLITAEVRPFRLSSIGHAF